MATRSRGNGTNFGWLKKSCDISTCDLNPDGNPEKYGRPMKSALQDDKIHCTKYVAHLHLMKIARILLYYKIDNVRTS